MSLNFDDIAAIVGESPDYIDVPVPKWGGSVRLKQLNAAEALAVGQTLRSPLNEGEADRELTPAEMVEFSVNLVSACAVNNDGSLMFDTDDKRDFLRKNAGIITRLGEAAIALHDLGGASEKN